MDVLQSLIAEERRQDRAAVRAFVDAVGAADGGRCFDSFEALEHRGMWRSAMRAIAKAPCTSDEFRLRWLGVYISHGDHFRHTQGQR